VRCGSRTARQNVVFIAGALCFSVSGMPYPHLTLKRRYGRTERRRAAYHTYDVVCNTRTCRRRTPANRPRLPTYLLWLTIPGHGLFAPLYQRRFSFTAISLRYAGTRAPQYHRYTPTYSGAAFTTAGDAAASRAAHLRRCLHHPPNANYDLTYYSRLFWAGAVRGLSRAARCAFVAASMVAAPPVHRQPRDAPPYHYT